MTLEELLRKQDGLVTRSQALAGGLSPAALRHRLRPSGPWQPVLPGVIASFTGSLSDRQRTRAALLHAGPTAQVAGRSAVRGWRLRALADDGRVHVLVAHGTQPMSRGFVVVRRSTRLAPPVTLDGLPTSPLPRAVVDAARELATLREVRALVAEPVQRGRTTVQHLAREVAEGHSAGSRLVRTALGEVAAGTRSATEAELRELLLRSPLLQHARWNVRLVDAAGRWLADPDCYLEEAGVVVESDSRAWHLSPADWEATMARHSRMAGAGLQVLHVPPQRHRSQPGVVLAEVEQAYRAALLTGPAPGVRIVPAARPSW